MPIACVTTGWSEPFGRLEGASSRRRAPLCEREWGISNFSINNLNFYHLLSFFFLFIAGPQFTEGNASGIGCSGSDVRGFRCLRAMMLAGSPGMACQWI